MNLSCEIDRILPEVIGIRRHVHMYPELSGEERETTAYLCDVLDKNNIAYTVLPDNCGVVASVGQGSDAVGVRAELDALPVTEETGLEYASKIDGVMHACGHDIHFAAALGLLLLLKPYEKELDHVVRVFFQPAEETVGGANDMILHGCMQNPEVRTVFGFHISPTKKTGTVEYLIGAMNAAVTDFELTVRGRSCHGAHPEQGIDAIVAAAGIVTALQSIPSRRFAPTTPTIVTVGTINGGTAENVVAGEVKMSGTLRALDMDVMAELKDTVRETCENTAQGFGASAEINYTTEYPVLYNESELTENTIGKIAALIGKDNIQKMDAPSLGADDFAFFCKHARCCYFNIGCRSKSQGDDQVLHSSCLAPDEDSLRIALQILCAIV
ncbi:MAG: amidohydrolase [Clostridia bacterium]|nr:amidohydrolase [Clostridia bacterium]